MSSRSRSYSRSKSRGRRSYETKSPSRSRSRDRKRRRRSVSSRRSRSASGSRGRGSPQRGGRRGGANKFSQNKLDSLARQHDDGGKKVYIGNLSSRCHERDLEEIFGTYGEIEDVYIPRDKSTWLGKGFAFVTFAKIEPAVEASESWDQKRFMGRRIAVNLARPRPNARNSSPTGGRIRTYVPSRDDSSERDRRRRTRSYSR